MKSIAKYLVIASVLFGFALMVTMCAQAGEEKSVSTNPIRDTIDKTASVKAMQSQPARSISYIYDVLGNKVPTQTDNSGKI